MATKTDRVEARLSAEERQQIRRAAQFTGQSVSSFIVSAAVEKAEEVISDRTATTVPAEYFDRLVAEIDRAEKAPRLKRAREQARRRSAIH